ncbi:MAG: methylenetetrahydrofolate reductase, partial [Nitrospinae bacterium]|nr:methylenetetrahydrofolate reductase [Nitrospinota bacterium]
MKINDLLDNAKKFVSLEFFPPKDKSAWPDFFNVVASLKAVNPLFVSVTYGAGGSTHFNTLEIVTRIKKEYGLEPMAHLTCVGASDEKITGFLSSLRDEGIENVLALRGDPPKGDTTFKPDNERFRHADDLVRFIRAGFPSMGVGVAAYPETHPEAVSPEADLGYLKQKLDAGSGFAITQLFFDNSAYWSFAKRAKAMGIEKPIIPGVLPVVNLAGAKRIAGMCGAKIPPALLVDLEEAEKRGGQPALEEVGISYAANQAKELLR